MTAARWSGLAPLNRQVRDAVGVLRVHAIGEVTASQTLCLCHGLGRDGGPAPAALALTDSLDSEDPHDSCDAFVVYPHPLVAKFGADSRAPQMPSESWRTAGIRAAVRRAGGRSPSPQQRAQRVTPNRR
ncbi:hypothetical protein OG462_43035 [Streptomyces sp. NBC_01077]|uniref:hypothetical protein n=1 Tax=Streptomyces sp. NBC_01077 TaxID=2903746 RepID=UPI0038705128|nr:hypothetical protein OG462_01970 [Streptomyces sp. NBC_01077]WSV43576.1 hypothetical protein OG462_43035 [Streptomyces sp. NBC_01077]